MSEVEILGLKLLTIVFILMISILWSAKPSNAQANILASTPTGTTFCSTNAALSSVDMSNCIDGMAIPVGSSSQRSSSPISGTVRYNNSSNNIEAYSGGMWWPMVPQVNADWNASSGVSKILNEPTIPTVPTNVSAFTNDVPYATVSSVAAKFTIPVGTSGQYLNGVGTPVNFPVIPSAQVNSDWNSSSGVSQILNKPTIPVVQSYENTTQHLNPILINKSVAVAGGAGNATFNLTADGTAGGTALCQNGVMLNSPNLSVNDATAPYQFGWTWSNANKTVTVLTQKASGLAVLTFTLLGIPAPVANGTVVNETVICY